VEILRKKQIIPTTQTGRVCMLLRKVVARTLTLKSDPLTDGNWRKRVHSSEGE
jgi:hypothetical protein